MRCHIGAGLVQVHVLINVIDPRYRDKMMMLAVRRALLGELDLVGAVEMIDLSDGLSVRRDDVHVLFDLRCIWHMKLLKTLQNKRSAAKKVAPASRRGN
jgi:hypothetical protein